MNCRHYEHSTQKIQTLSPGAITIAVHGCRKLHDRHNQAKVQQVLLPLGLCGSLMPTTCPVADRSQSEWQRCPLYELV